MEQSSAESGSCSDDEETPHLCLKEVATDSPLTLMYIRTQL
jgi:hypothetical protein